MNRDLTRWLKDDLGLENMSEADLNGLMYHPRHGNLCRRFVKFLAESTLCSRRYPNVKAKEEYEIATRELQDKERELHDLMVKLEYRLRVGNNIEQELASLKERRDYIKKIEDLAQTTNEAFDQIADRPGVVWFEKLRKDLADPNYLHSEPLKDLYPSKLNLPMEKPTGERDKKRLEEEYNEQVQSASTLHSAIRLMLAEAKRHSHEADDEMRDLVKPQMDELIALKVPKCTEVELLVGSEERELLGKREELIAKVLQERQQVFELKRKYANEKAKLTQKYEDELKDDLQFLQELGKCEKSILADADK